MTKAEPYHYYMGRPRTAVEFLEVEDMPTVVQKFVAYPARRARRPLGCPGRCARPARPPLAAFPSLRYSPSPVSC